MAQKLTAKALRSLAGPPEGRPWVIHYDEDLPGFGIRITRAGARSLILNYRANGIERRITIDSIPTGATVEETDRLIAKARRSAAATKSGAKYEGVDPMSARHDARAAVLVSDLAQRYLDEHAPKKRESSRREDASMIEKIILPELKNKRVADVRYSDIDSIHRKVSRTAPTRANRVVSLLSKMFSLAIKWDLRSDNPARGIERNPEERRKRYLSQQELLRLGKALVDHTPKASANAIRLLMLTGARRGEVLSSTWDQFDLSQGIWTKPSSHTKQKKEHRVPLSAPARQLIAEMQKDASAAAKKKRTEISPFLFPGDEAGKAQAELKHSWSSICKAAKISGVRLHDLRHTYASVLASAGLTLPIIGQLLGHTNPNTTARYAHLFDDPLRAATERAASILMASPAQEPAEIVSIRRP